MAPADIHDLCSYVVPGNWTVADCRACEPLSLGAWLQFTSRFCTQIQRPLYREW